MTNIDELIKRARLTKGEIDKILEDKWAHDFTKKAMPRLTQALLGAQQEKDFNLQVSKEGECPECLGGKGLFDGSGSAAMIPCYKCHGTGKQVVTKASREWLVDKVKELPIEGGG